MHGLTKRLGWTAWDLAMGATVGLLAGGASAGFLWLLERTIALRVAHPWLLAGLPLFGVLSAWLYRRYGRESEGGSPMVLDEVLEFRGRVRTRLALVLIGALLTHLGGGSAGREGTAVQMGASLARTLGKLPFRWLRLTRSRQRLLIMAGISGGFGSLFGTPVAGALFGLEAIAPGRLHAEGLVVCAAASFVGDLACRALGAKHGAWPATALEMDTLLLAKVALFAIPVALVAVAFTRASHGLAAWTKARIAHWALRPALGGVAVLALFLLFPDEGHLNLGLPFLERIFHAHAPVAPWAFALKLAFTCVTLGFGFKGGEVTPLFVIGALVGAALAPVFGWPPPFAAALGMTGLFAAASNTPLASLLLGIEFFGPGFAAPLALLCFLAFVLAGHPGIYGARRAADPASGA